MEKKHVLKYHTFAEDSLEGWEKYSLPIGNGYFGASIFGRTDSERIQFTTNTFANVYAQGGVSNFAEIRLDFGVCEPSDYERGLLFEDGYAYTRFRDGNNAYALRYYYSYPDRVFVCRISCTEKTDFSVRLVIPYLGARTAAEGGRTGTVTAEKNVLTMRGELPSRDLLYEGRVCVTCDGDARSEGEKLVVRGARETTVYFVAETSYELKEEVFLSGGHKALGKDPHDFVENTLQNALNLGEETLFSRHQADYCGLIGRVQLDLGGVEDARATDELLESYREGNAEPYLEECYYQFGRHLLVSSSRKGTLPASLQGVWSAHDKSPWGSGFWHNINVQMNYWGAFSTNLAETFEAYVAFNQAFRKEAENLASEWVQKIVPENYVSGQGACGWGIGVASFCYEISGPSVHSGPGTGGLTTAMFWDYYDYTRDEKILQEVTYPAIHGMARFLTKSVRDYDGEYLVCHSASPEQIIGGKWITQAQVPPDYKPVALKEQPYYHTVGCAFDQQMLYENAKNDLKCAELLGISDDVIALEKRQINAYSPVLIGYSGQIKEYREETFYGEIGEAKHRHISQLVALSPGTAINGSTPAWQDSARKTLELRGDDATGWALAHRLCAWARTGEGEHAYALLQKLLKTRTHPNLWDVHPPFQIDGNFGALSGMTEMLLQSYDDCIELFPALPSAWRSLSFHGLKARGNITVSAVLKDGKTERVELTPAKDGRIRLVARGVSNVCVRSDDGELIPVVTDERTCSFDGQGGKTYVLTGFSAVCRCEKPTALQGKFDETAVCLSWQGNAEKYAVYRAVENEATYRLLGYTNQNQYVDSDYGNSRKARLTYRVTALTKEDKGESDGVAVSLNPATKLQIERYAHVLRQNNVL